MENRCIPWKNVTLGPKDPILGITEAFRADQAPEKVNLGVGAYRDDNGKPFVLECVKKAELMMASIYKDKEYIPIEGLSEFNMLACKLAYGNLADSLPIAVCQSISGTGALKLCSEFLAKFGNVRSVFIPNPTWGNHVNIFRNAGFNVCYYRYWDAQNLCLDFPGMLEDIGNAETGSVILLHACAHNPTGVDPTQEQWGQVQLLIEAKKHTALFDCAYQGFASGNTDTDALALRSFVASGKVPIVVAQSFAKNFGLYGERVGTFSVVCSSEDEKERVMSQLKIIARPIYSIPPIHGARLVAVILGDATLTELWLSEVKMMAQRIISMRALLKQELEALGSKKSWSHITSQIGMFCYTGMNQSEVSNMTEIFHIYPTKDGRISMAGVNTHNIKYIARAIFSCTEPSA